MGLMKSKPSTMGENYINLAAHSASLTVHFYGRTLKKDPLLIPLETPCTCEQVLITCSEYLERKLGPFFNRECEKTIGPLLLPMFGLYAKDHSLQQWVSESQVFDQSNCGQEFYFRVKVQPPATASATDGALQGIFADYLFWQCVEDFVSGRVWQLFGADNKIKDIDSVNFNVLHSFMASAPYHLHDIIMVQPTQMLNQPLCQITTLQFIQKKVRPWNILHHFPEQMSPELQKEYNQRKDPLLRLVAYHYMRKYVREFFQHNKALSLRALRATFVSRLLKEYVPKYGLHYFPAEKLSESRPVPVELIIRPFQDGCTPGLYFNKRLVSRLQDILTVDIMESHNNQKVQVILEFRNQASMILQMNSRELAESFVSLLDIYYRLKVNYHSSLRTDSQKAPLLKILTALHSYGPMREEDARQHLRRRIQDDQRLSPDLPQYMIYQDCIRFGLLHVLSSMVGSDHFTSFDIGFRQLNSQGGVHYTVYAQSAESGEVKKEMDDPRELIMFLNNGHHQRIIPREEELCGVMLFMKDSCVDPYYSEISSTRHKAPTKERPVLYREDQIDISQGSLIVKGEFSEVYSITQKEQERKAVLKKVTTTDPAVEEAYRKGAERLCQLSDGCHFFVKVYGFMFANPVRIIMESITDKGSLLQRLTSGSLAFTWLHFSSVLHQLAACLDFLDQKRLFYGSFCCANILILSEDEESNSIFIRLGDPSDSVYMDSQRLDNLLNLKRLAWVAPERFGQLSHHEVASEVYAVATTLWEMAAYGQQPSTFMPNHKTGQELVKHISRGWRLPLDFLGVESPLTVVSQLSGSSVSQERTRQWLSRENLEQQAREDAQQTSGDVLEYVRGTHCGDDSAQGAGGDQERTAVVQPNLQLQEMKRIVRRLISAMWDGNPSQRPPPTEIRKEATIIRRLAMQASEEDPKWQESRVWQFAMETSNISEQTKAQNLIQDLRAQFRVNYEGQPRPTEEQERLEKLEMEVRNSMQCSIEVSRLDFTNSRQIGKGNFGVVKTAVLSKDCETRAEEANSDKMTVAVKAVSNNHKPDEVSQFLKEALCIYGLHHSNITRLIGIVMKGMNNPYQLVMEYADLGSLEDYVKKNHGRCGMIDFKKELKSFALDVCKGMEYVCKLNRVHGDLAARNVLLFSTEGLKNRTPIAKLCDFGLSRQLSMGYYYLSQSKNKSHELPAYMMPPEILHSWIDNIEGVKFTNYCDIWSYGIFLWEIFSSRKPEGVLGTIPTQILSRWNKERYPLARPEHCPQKMYDVMIKCWQREKEDRPKFDQLVTDIDTLTDADLF